jgi:hypothetical protein
MGPGTLMDKLMREYWLPCLLSCEFPGPDLPVKRMTLSGREFRYVARPHGADGRTQWRGHLSPASRASGHVRCDDHAVRKQLIQAAKRFDRTGELPENIDDECLNRVRCATVLLPKDVDWIKEPETARTADETKELAFKHHLVPDAQSALNGWRTRAAIHCPGI